MNTCETCKFYVREYSTDAEPDVCANPIVMSFCALDDFGRETTISPPKTFGCNEWKKKE